MKTRIHIHRENVSGTVGRKTFIVTLPRDAEKIVAIGVSTVGLKKSDGENHFEAGMLRVTRDGVLLFETQVRNEFQDADFDFNPAPSFLDNSFKAVSGGMDHALNVTFPGSPRSLFCRYDGNKAPSSLAYKIALYFIYTKKQKQ